MKIVSSQITKLYLTELDRLDPVAVFVDDIGPRQGQITITCYGKAWTAYWIAMHTTLKEFFCSCNESYLVGNLSDVKPEIIDYDTISEAIGERVDGNTMLLTYEDKIIEVYGMDWTNEIPRVPNPDYVYLCRIIRAVKAAFQELAKN